MIGAGLVRNFLGQINTIQAAVLAQLAAAAGSTLVGFLQAGVGAIARTLQAKSRERVSVEDFGAVGDGVADDTAAIQAALATLGNGGTLCFCNQAYLVTGTLQVNVKNITFLGVNRNAELRYRGNGALIELGTDDGLMWDAGNYNGTAQGFTLENVSLRCINDGTAGQLRTALLNSITGAFYGTGTYAIRDWRGGSTRLRRVKIEGFEFGYWGVQADINVGEDLVFATNHVAAFLGPRSDQGTWDKVWSYGNDTVWLYEGCRVHLVTQWITDTDGSGTTAPCIIRNSSPARSAKYAATRTHAGIVFDAPWLEQLGSFGNVNPGYDVQYVFDVGMGDGATPGGGVVIRSPYANSQLYSDATKPHFFYLVRAADVQAVTVDELSGPRTFKAVFCVDASAVATPRLFFSDADNTGGNIVESFNALSTYIRVRSAGFSQAYTANARGGTGFVNIGNLGLQRALVHNNTAAVGGQGGDITLNRNFSTGKSLGWAWNGGAPTVIHAPTVSGNRGAISTTLAPETDHEEQLWATLFDSDEDVVLAAPPVATVTGYRFRIARSAGGAFNLNVRNLAGGGALLKAMPANSWAEFLYDGANWTLRAAGSL